MQMQASSISSSAWFLLSLLQLCSTTATAHQLSQAQNEQVHDAMMPSTKLTYLRKSRELQVQAASNSDTSHLTFSPIEDATIYSSQTDYDTLNQLIFTGQSSSPELNSLLKFDLTFMNDRSSRELNRAELHLCNSFHIGGAFDPLAVNIYGVLPSFFYGGGDWSESSVSWWYSPKVDVNGGKAKFVESHMNDFCIWHTFSVIDLVRSSLENPMTMKSLTLRIVSENDLGITMYASKDFQHGKVAPRLDVYFGQGEDNTQLPSPFQTPTAQPTQAPTNLPTPQPTVTVGIDAQQTLPTSESETPAAAVSSSLPNQPQIEDNTEEASNAQMTLPTSETPAAAVPSSLPNQPQILALKGCSFNDKMVADWSSSHTYDATDIVTNYNKVYECKPHPFSGWCNDYEPGVKSALPGSGGVMIPWRDAWTEKGDCREIEMDSSLLDSSRSVYDSELCATPIYGKGGMFSAKDRVLNEDAIYECNVPSWCSSSVKEYEPGNGTYWKLAWTLVQESLGCPDVTDAPASDAAVATLAADYPAPTSYPTKLGRAVYYGDFRTTSCQSINDLIQSKPDWLQEEDMFKSKEECCNEMFSWIPLETCLGPGFVESNYVIGSRSPSSTPTMSVTTVPSSRPSVSSVPSSSPSPPILPQTVDSIHQQTAMSAPTTKDELTAQADTNFLVEMLGWANAGMPEVVLPEGSTVDTSSSSSSPVEVEESSQISELTLPIISDATLSRNRRSATFGSNTALAVDGEADNRYDSLLKFDVGMIDSTRNIETAVLKVYAQSNCLETTFTTTVDNDWDHAEVTWDTAPSARLGGILFGAIKEVGVNEWYEIDITTAIEWHGNNTSLGNSRSNDSFLSIRLASTEKSRCLYSSMESGAHAPVIVVKYLTHHVHVADPKPAAGQFILLQADADSTISASQPTTVLSKEPTLMVEFDPFTRNIHDALIRFDLSKTGGTYPRSAILSLFSEISCKSAGTFATTTTSGDTNWDESTITWSTAPGAGDGGQYQSNGVMIGTFGAVSKNRWHGFDVSEAIRVAILAKKKDVTFRISSGNTESCLYSSKESGREPKLMVSF